MCSYLLLFAFEFVSKFLIIMTEPDCCPIPSEILYQLSVRQLEGQRPEPKKKKKKKVDQKIIEEQYFIVLKFKGAEEKMVEE